MYISDGFMPRRGIAGFCNGIGYVLVMSRYIQIVSPSGCINLRFP